MSKKTPIQASYDLVAEQYADNFFDELNRKPFDRQLLDRFAASILQDNQGRQEDQEDAAATVWDLGCGPGHVGRYLAERGVTVCGLDLSEQMVAVARRLNPDMAFTQGTMLALPVGDGALAGIVAFYAIIHLTRAEAQDALREFHRALRPGGQLFWHSTAAMGKSIEMSGMVRKWTSPPRSSLAQRWKAMPRRRDSPSSSCCTARPTSSSIRANDSIFGRANRRNWTQRGYRGSELPAHGKWIESRWRPAWLQLFHACHGFEKPAARYQSVSKGNVSQSVTRSCSG